MFCPGLIARCSKNDNCSTRDRAFHGHFLKVYGPRLQTSAVHKTVNKELHHYILPQYVPCAILVTHFIQQHFGKTSMCVSCDDIYLDIFCSFLLQ